MLESDEVRNYFESMLDNQTEQVKKYISDSKTQLSNEEISQLKEQLAIEKQKVQVGEKIVEDTKTKLKTTISLLEEKNGLIEKIQTELEQTKSSLQEKIIKVSQLEKEKSNVEKQSEEKITKIKENLNLTQSEKAKCEGTLKELYEKFGSVDKTIKKYQSLSLETKNRLHNIIIDDSVYSIMGSSADWRNVEGIWEFAKRRVVEKEYEDAELLKDIFEFLLIAYNAQNGNNKYKLISPSIGDKFDSDIHSIIGIQTDGFVKHIYLSGVMSVHDNKIVQKALIEV